jgi:hypothetical protein
VTPPLQLAGGVELPTVVRAVTAVVGFFVAYQAYRGYRRNDSRPMLYLGVGIAFVTTVSFVVSTLVVRPLGASDALSFLSWTFANVVGLAAIFYAFTGATGGHDGDRGRGQRQGRTRGERRDGDRSARGDGSGGSRPAAENDPATDGDPPMDSDRAVGDDPVGGGDR